MPTSGTGLLPRRNSGYTLIELVVVVFIIGLFLAIVTPRLLDRLFEVRLTGTARQIGSAISYLHSQAAFTGKKHRLYYNITDNIYWAEIEEKGEEEDEVKFIELGGPLGRITALENGVKFSDITTPRETNVSSGVCWTEFSALGFAEDTLIHLKDEQDRGTTLVIKPFSGRVEIYDGEK